MRTFRYSAKAEQELADVLAYTTGEWGEAQAQQYFQQLADTFNLLACYPDMGRRFSVQHVDWRRFEQGSHIIVYRPLPNGILIQRLVHQRQLLTRHTKLI